MFQNDYDPSAASSQQTNSAISVHMVRLTRGRFYALFVASIILTSWLQAVAQVQTAISLLLLAIIGLFLGKVTDSAQGEPAYLVAGKLVAVAKLAEATGSVSKEREAGGGPSGRKRELGSPGSSASGLSASESASGSAGDPEAKPAELGALAERSGLNLLKTLDGSGGGGNVNSPVRIHSATSGFHAPKGAPGKTAQTSPSASTSSASPSSASTGYNSDSRSTNLGAASPQICAKQQQQQLQSALVASAKRELDESNEFQGETIELVRQPTALRLIMDEFAGVKSQQAACQTPDKPPRLEASRFVPVDVNAESHYSTPTFAFKQTESERDSSSCLQK